MSLMDELNGQAQWSANGRIERRIVIVGSQGKAMRGRLSGLLQRIIDGREGY